MTIEKVSIKGFRCFGPRGTDLKLESSITVLVGGNGSGKTAVFQALSRLFGVSPAQRTVRRLDFHLLPTRRSFRPGPVFQSRCSFRFQNLTV